MRGREIADIKAIRMGPDSRQRVSAKNASCVSGDMAVLFWIIMNNSRVSSLSKAFVVNLQDL